MHYFGIKTLSETLFSRPSKKPGYGTRYFGVYSQPQLDVPVLDVVIEHRIEFFTDQSTLGTLEVPRRGPLHFILSLLYAGKRFRIRNSAWSG